MVSSEVPCTIRPLLPQDEPFLWEMLYQAIYVPPGDAPPARSILDQPELAHYVRGWGRPGDLGLLAEDAEGSPLGAAWLRLFDADDPGYGFVDDQTPELSIALLPGARGWGTGSRLMAALLEQARAAGHRTVSLSVSPDSPALRLYQQLGFVTVGQVGGSLTMLKELSKGR